MAFSAKAEIIEGTCGENLIWRLDTETVTLTISGSGSMTDFGSSPWKEYVSQIEFVVIEDGVTTIGNYAFANCSNIKSVTFGNSLTIIGEKAFSGCTRMHKIDIPEPVTMIEKQAFWGCSSLRSLSIPKTLTSFYSNAFYLTKLEKITVDPENEKFDSRDDCNGIVVTATDKLVLACKNTVITNTIKIIGSYVFENMSSLESVEMPESVTKIESFAFSDCENLKHVKLGNSLINIGYGAFYMCEKLDSIYIPASVKTMKSAFTFCSGLKSIIVDPENTEFDSRENCNALISTSDNQLVNGCNNSFIPGSVKSLSSYAFFSCKEMTEMVIPDSVSVIGSGAFEYCTALNTVKLASTLTKIGDDAFSECYSLKNIFSFATTPPECGKTVFGHDSYTVADVATLYVPFGCGQAYREANAWKDFTDIVELPEGYGDDENYSGICGDELFWLVNTKNYTLTISGKGDMYDYTFWPNDSTCAPWREYSDYIDHIVVNPGVESIGEHAFTFCEYVKSVSLPNTLISLKYKSLYGCDVLENITLPNSLKRIEDLVFCHCRKLKSLTIPSSVEYIGEDILAGHMVLESVSVDPENKYYDSRENCNGIIETATNTLIYGYEKTVIPNTVTAIGASAFANCIHITTVEIPNSVTSIGRNAFGYCTALDSIMIPNSVTSIGERAFNNCKKLRYVHIPENITYIGNTTFIDCVLLEAIELPNTVDSIGHGAFCGCKKIETFTMPEKITTIAEYTFQECLNLKTITLSNIITSVECGAFSGCNSLTGIELPNTTESIDAAAFRNCNSLTFVRCLAPIPPVCLSDYIFEQKVYDSTTLYVPFGSIQDYRIADCWKRFNNIEELAPGYGVDENQPIEISVFPNPATNFINIICENMKSLEIYSLDGKQIKKMTVSGNETQVDISELNNGIYLIRIETASGIINSKFNKK